MVMVRMSLNPYCIGSSNHALNILSLIEDAEVLILIVLDHLIMLKVISSDDQFTIGLNPYCIGSSNHAVITPRDVEATF